MLARVARGRAGLANSPETALVRGDGCRDPFGMSRVAIGAGSETFGAAPSRS